MIVPLLFVRVPAARTLAEVFFTLADAFFIAEDFAVADFVVPAEAFFAVDFLLFEVDFEIALLETLRVDFVEEAIFIL